MGTLSRRSLVIENLHNFEGWWRLENLSVSQKNLHWKTQRHVLNRQSSLPWCVLTAKSELVFWFRFSCIYKIKPWEWSAYVLSSCLYTYANYIPLFKSQMMLCDYWLLSNKSYSTEGINHHLTYTIHSCVVLRIRAQQNPVSIYVQPFLLFFFCCLRCFHKYLVRHHSCYLEVVHEKGLPKAALYLLLGKRY